MSDEIERDGRLNLHEAPEDVGSEEPEGESPDEDVELAEPSAGDQSQRLDPLAVKLWRIEGLLSLGSLCVGALVGGSVLWSLTPTPGWVVLAAWTALGSLLYLVVGWLPPRRYGSWSYQLSEPVLELRYGVFWQMSVKIPLTRLQHVDLQRGPLDRRFGLVSLKVHTAGTSHATHEIPFLAEEVGLRLRERLIAAADLYSE